MHEEKVVCIVAWRTAAWCGLGGPWESLPWDREVVVEEEPIRNVLDFRQVLDYRKVGRVEPVPKGIVVMNRLLTYVLLVHWVSFRSGTGCAS